MCVALQALTRGRVVVVVAVGGVVVVVVAVGVGAIPVVPSERKCGCAG